MTFCFDNFMVGVHLGQTMGEPREGFLTHPDLTRYMRAVKDIIGPRPTPNCTKILVLGALASWSKHPVRDFIILGLDRWSNELTGNPTRESYQWNGDWTANIHVYLNSPNPPTFAFFKADNTMDKGGKITAVNNGDPIAPRRTFSI